MATTNDPHWPFHAKTVGDLYQSADDVILNGADSYQVGGSHYQKAIQPWDAMEAWMTHDEFCAYLQGNIIKYAARYKDKGGAQDVKKLIHYAKKLLETLEAHNA